MNNTSFWYPLWTTIIWR